MGSISVIPKIYFPHARKNSMARKLMAAMEQFLEEWWFHFMNLFGTKGPTNIVQICHLKGENDIWSLLSALEIT